MLQGPERTLPPVCITCPFHTSALSTSAVAFCMNVNAHARRLRESIVVGMTSMHLCRLRSYHRLAQGKYRRSSHRGRQRETHRPSRWASCSSTRFDNAAELLAGRRLHERIALMLRSRTSRSFNTEAKPFGCLASLVHHSRSLSSTLLPRLAPGACSRPPPSFWLMLNYSHVGRGSPSTSLA